MARPIRKNLGGTYYHVLNRANGRLRIFKKRGDFLAFEEILGEAQERFEMRICGYCVMGEPLAFVVASAGGWGSFGVYAMGGGDAYDAVSLFAWDGGDGACLTPAS